MYHANNWGISISCWVSLGPSGPEQFGVWCAPVLAEFVFIYFLGLFEYCHYLFAYLLFDSFLLFSLSYSVVDGRPDWIVLIEERLAALLKLCFLLHYNLSFTIYLEEMFLYKYHR